MGKGERKQADRRGEEAFEFRLAQRLDEADMVDDGVFLDDGLDLSTSRLAADAGAAA